MLEEELPLRQEVPPQPRELPGREVPPLPELAPLPPSVLEERLRAEEEQLYREAQALERQVKRLHVNKAAARAA